MGRYHSKTYSRTLLFVVTSPINPTESGTVFFFFLFFFFLLSSLFHALSNATTSTTATTGRVVDARRRRTAGSVATTRKPVRERRQWLAAARGADGPFASRNSGGGIGGVKGVGELGASECADASRRLHSRDARSATTDRHHRDPWIVATIPTTPNRSGKDGPMLSRSSVTSGVCTVLSSLLSHRYWRRVLTSVTGKRN